jgi:hypothetical protein
VRRKEYYKILERRLPDEAYPRVFKSNVGLIERFVNQQLLDAGIEVVPVLRQQASSSRGAASFVSPCLYGEHRHQEPAVPLQTHFDCKRV